MPTYVRVKDPSTGHEFDVPTTSPLLRNQLVAPVKGERYPPTEYPRAQKHHIKLAERPAPREKPTSTGAAATEKESHNG